jgi:hypothetical protein
MWHKFVFSQQVAVAVFSCNMLFISVDNEVVDAQTGRLLSEEREYGKIPKRIYLQYLQACSVCVGTSYLVSTFGWQGLRVYTDYWLNQWTDSGNTGSSTLNDTWDYEVRKFS